MGAGVERNFRFRGQRDVHKHTLPVQRSEWRHGARLAIRKQARELALLRQPDLAAAQMVHKTARRGG